MIAFLNQDSASDSWWRAIVLFGSNTTSYKFALAQALLGFAGRGQTTVSIEELAKPFALALCEHLGKADRQGTGERNSFLNACRRHNAGELPLEQLVEETVMNGFRYVLDRFHIVNGAPLPTKFYVDEVRTSKRLTLTDTILKLPHDLQFANLGVEVEAPWRLVETAWQLGIGRGMLTVTHDPSLEEFFVSTAARRITLTSSRSALNGTRRAGASTASQRSAS